MQVTFQLTLPEFKAFQRAVTAQNGPFARFAPFLFLPLLVVILPLQMASDPRTRLRFAHDPIRELLGIAPFLFGVLTVMFVVSWLIKRQNEQNLLKTPLLSAPVSVSIDDIGVTGHDSDSQTTTLWRAVHSVFQTPELIVVMVQKGAGLIVPKRAFGTPGEANDFFERAEQLWRAHHPDAPPIPKP